MYTEAEAHIIECEKNIMNLCIKNLKNFQLK